MSKKEDIRFLALESLMTIEKTARKSNEITDAVLERYSYLDKADRAFYTRLVRGTCENSIRSDMILNTYSTVSVIKMKPAIRWILRMAVYQIEKMDSVPARAAVNEAVRLAGAKGFRSLKGFVNGVLRGYLREPEKFREPGREEPVRYLQAVYSVPEYLAGKWVKRFGPEIAEKICASFGDAGKLTVRILRDREQTLEELKKEGITFRPSVYEADPKNTQSAKDSQGAKESQSAKDTTAVTSTADVFMLSGIDRLSDLASFRNGAIIVQDVSSMLAIRAAGINPGDCIMDVCAAPGGKSILASELTGESGGVLSCDISPSKTVRIEENILRCGISNIHVEVRDACVHDPALDGTMDVVIADVPCSGYGVIGKKSDILFSASEEKERSLAQLQKKILEVSSRYVKKGGVLLYSTCTISETENEDNVKWFLVESDQGRGFRPESLAETLPEMIKCESAKDGYVQLLPGVHDCDGFFYAKFRRI